MSSLSLRLSLLLVLCLFSPLVSADAPWPCSWTASDGTYFDWSSLTTSTGTQLIDTQHEVGFINMCAAVNPTSQYPDSSLCVQQNAMLCLRRYFTGPVWIPVLGYTTPAPTITLIDPNNPKAGVKMAFANTRYENQQLTGSLTLACDPTVDAPTYAATPQSPTDYTATITSKYCCPTAPASSSSGGKGGLSGGWVFIIIFLVTLFLYISVGCFYKHYRVGTRGLESCPNVDFWREFPGLIKDGIVFFFRKCQECCAGGNRGSSSGGSGNYGSSDTYGSMK